MITKETVNCYLRRFFIHRTQRAYIKKVNAIFKKNPGLAASVDSETTKKHLDLFGRLGYPCHDHWLRLYTNLSGIADYTYLPQDLYYTVIERVLCDCDRNGGESEDKNLLSKIIPYEYLPKTYLRYIRGIFYDEEYNFLTNEQAHEVLSRDNSDLIGKIAHDSCGGFGVRAFKFSNGSYRFTSGHPTGKSTDMPLSINTIIGNDSYILQEKLTQCEFSAQFNPTSLNTLRMITLRCPWDGKVVVCKSAMRIGRSGEVVDNLSSGGLALSLDKDGTLSEFAVQYNGFKKYYAHPDTGVTFKGKRHPYYRQMCETITSLAHRLPHFNMISWDVVATAEGDVKIIEVNLCSQGTNILQFDFGSVFGEYTEKIVDWVAEHKNLDNVRHLRTF